MTFEAYLEQYYANWADSKFIPEMKFDDLLRTYFSEWPNFTEWRCCNGPSLFTPGIVPRA
jgi:hypothetical protein